MEAGRERPRELWQAARDRHALKAVTLLGGRQDSEDQNGCGESSQRGAWARQPRQQGVRMGTTTISSTKKSNIREMAQLVKCLLFQYEGPRSSDPSTHVKSSAR